MSLPDGYEYPSQRTAQSVRICQALECNFGVDLIVRTPAKLTQRLAWGDFSGSNGFCGGRDSNADLHDFHDSHD